MNEKISSPRSSNLELYRIIVMLLIVAHHYVVNSGLFDVMQISVTSIKDVYFWLFGMWGKIGINCFVMITGYFMCTSNITLRKFLKLYLEILLYNVVISGIFTLCGKTTLLAVDFFQMLLPLGSLSDSFVGCYLVFYLFIPFLNVLIKNITQKQHGQLIGLTWLLFVLWDIMPEVDLPMSYVIWFMFIYIVGAYIRLYDFRNKMLRFLLDGNIIGTITMVGIAMASVVIMLAAKQVGLTHWWPCKWVVDCNALLALPCAVAMFNCFRRMPIPQSKFINAVGASCFGVLLIHANSDTMREWLWQDVYQNVRMFDTPYWFIHSIGCVLAIFAICVLIDQIRIHLLEKPFFKWYDMVQNKRTNK